MACVGVVLVAVSCAALPQMNRKSDCRIYAGRGIPRAVVILVIPVAAQRRLTDLLVMDSNASRGIAELLHVGRGVVQGALRRADDGRQHDHHDSDNRDRNQKFDDREPRLPRHGMD